MLETACPYDNSPLVFAGPAPPTNGELKPGIKPASGRETPSPATVAFGTDTGGGVWLSLESFTPPPEPARFRMCQADCGPAKGHPRLEHRMRVPKGPLSRRHRGHYRSLGSRIVAAIEPATLHLLISLPGTRATGHRRPREWVRPVLEGRLVLFTGWWSVSPHGMPATPVQPPQLPCFHPREYTAASQSGQWTKASN